MPIRKCQIIIPRYRNQTQLQWKVPYMHIVQSHHNHNHPRQTREQQHCKHHHHPWYHLGLVHGSGGCKFGFTKPVAFPPPFGSMEYRTIPSPSMSSWGNQWYLILPNKRWKNLMPRTFVHWKICIINIEINLDMIPSPSCSCNMWTDGINFFQCLHGVNITKSQTPKTHPPNNTHNIQNQYCEYGMIICI